MTTGGPETAELMGIVQGVSFSTFEVLAYRIAASPALPLGPAEARALSYRDFVRSLVITELDVARKADDRAKQEADGKARSSGAGKINGAIARPGLGRRRVS